MRGCNVALTTKNEEESNMNNVFKYEGNEVRTVIIEGEPWFVLKDICDALGLGQAAGVKRRLSRDVISNHPLLTAGGNQNVTVINEDGLYDVVLESRKPEARKFRKWITSEVLPTIRKTGGYVNNDELFVNTYLPFADDTTKQLFRSTLEVVRKQTERIKALEPKAAKYDEFLDASGLTTLTTIGKHFLGGLTPQQTRKWLQSEGVLYQRRVDGCYPPTDGFTKYFRIVPYYEGGRIKTRTVKVTAEGIDFIVELRRKREIGDVS